MRAGNLRHPVTIQESTITSDDYGGGNETWTTYATARAAIWPQKGKEVVIDKALQAYTHVIIRIRYQSGITNKMRVLAHTGQVYEILTVRNIEEKNRYIDMWCRAYE